MSKTFAINCNVHKYIDRVAMRSFSIHFYLFLMCQHLIAMLTIGTISPPPEYSRNKSLKLFSPSIHISLYISLFYLSLFYLCILN